MTMSHITRQHALLCETLSYLLEAQSHRYGRYFIAHKVTWERNISREFVTFPQRSGYEIM